MVFNIQNNVLLLKIKANNAYQNCYVTNFKQTFLKALNRSLTFFKTTFNINYNYTLQLIEMF